MLILSNCLTEKADEGCLKVANSLVKRILKEAPDTSVITYERKPNFDSLHLRLNKLLISKKLFTAIRKNSQPILYIPFPAKEWATALRVFLISLVSKKSVTVLLTMLCECGFFGRLLFKFSRAKIVTLSQSTQPIYKKAVGEKRVNYLKTGVDTERFCPVTQEKKVELRKKYGISPDKPVILHVGHLKSGRNIAEMKKFGSQYQVVLVVSTLTKDEQDETIRKELSEQGNIKIIDEYIPNIEEIYQLSDVYFFPVVASGNCIDIPLSCMEAASCNKPVVTTLYGEMSSFKGKDGFLFIESFDSEHLNDAVATALETDEVHTREQVFEYDWNNAVSYFKSIE